MSNSSTGAIYFTAQVKFNGPVQSGGLTAASFGVGSVAAGTVGSNSSANCSCGTTARRNATTGMSSDKLVTVKGVDSRCKSTQQLQTCMRPGTAVDAGCA